MAGEPYRELRLPTPAGIAAARSYAAPRATAGVICVGGVGGGWDSPANGLYPRLLEDLAKQGIAGLRVRYRNPVDLAMAEEDVLAGIAHLAGEGIERVGLIGHSFGGAVVIRAGASSPSVRTIITLATQSYGTEPAAHLRPESSLLAVHGTRDEILPPGCSVFVVHEASARKKELRLIEGARHGLGEAAQEIEELVREWLLEELKEAESRE